MEVWDVHLNGRLINMVWMDKRLKADEVRRVLIEEKGYSPDIKVYLSA